MLLLVLVLTQPPSTMLFHLRRRADEGVWWGAELVFCVVEENVCAAMRVEGRNN